MPELSASLQDYLEKVLFLQKANGEVRVADLADFMHVKKPSVVKSLLKLKELGLIRQKPYGPVVLTVNGLQAAEKISLRHFVLKDFFANVLDIDDKTAEEDACRMEHVISSKAFRRLSKFVDRYKKEAESVSKSRS